MVFGIFGSKRPSSVLDLVKDYALYQNVMARIAKAQSLKKLGRSDEMQAIVKETEQLVLAYIRRHPTEKLAQVALALLYKECGVPETAIEVLSRLLKPGAFDLSEADRLILAAELQKLERERPANQRATDGPKDFTQIYVCQNCGRLHNFASMPCPHCDWGPQTKQEMAISLALSNAHFKVPALLVLCRQMDNGRSPDDVIPNLAQNANTYLTSSSHRQLLDRAFALLHENQHRNHRQLSVLKACPQCGSSILMSDSEDCAGCGTPTKWPDAVRALVCMDNLLWLFERRVEPSDSKDFSELVCLLVRMTNNLLRKQEGPTPDQRRYGLTLLQSLGALSDLNKGAVVETKTPKDMKIFLVKDRMLEDSQTFGIFLFKELEQFVGLMVRDIRL